jgi:rSAM/selenodomain-associated transferase 1
MNTAAAGRPPQRLVMLARWPAPGRCKQRLAAELGHRRAAAVQQRLTAHGLAACRLACAGGGTELVLASSGVGSRAARRWGEQQGVDRVLPQGPGSLGVKLQRQLVWAQRQGVRALVMVGSDLPHLAAADLRAAFRALGQGSPLVLGPACDGGYWLIGLGWGAAAAPPLAWGRRLFAGTGAPIGWGGAQVLEHTLAAAAAEGLAVTLLGQRGDLDRGADLRPWR